MPAEVEARTTQLNSRPHLTMYTTRWCGDCHRSKAFLRRHGVVFDEVDIEDDPQAAATVVQLNRGFESVPTIVFPDGTFLTEPSNRDLARKLGLAS